MPSSFSVRRLRQSDFGTRSATSARPPPYTHIAGSLFATYTGSASCFLQTSHLWKCPCLVGVALPSDHGGLPRYHLLSSACVSCPAHVSDVADQLRHQMRKHINRLDPTRFIRELNSEFFRLSNQGNFATALIVSYYAPAEYLVVCNAGHPRPVWYRSRLETWRRLEYDMAGRIHDLANLPLGIVESTTYHQFAVRLEEGDLVLLYSDAAIEVQNSQGEPTTASGSLRTALRNAPTRSGFPAR